MEEIKKEEVLETATVEESTEEVAQAVVVEAEVKQEVKRPQRRAPKKKVCAFCVEKAVTIDYKDVNKLRRYITEKGKILPARQTNVCAKHQRDLAKAIKRARCAALLPFRAE